MVITMASPQTLKAILLYVAQLAFYCNNDEVQIDRIFRGSARYRKKWGEKHGFQTYGEMTIQKAVANAIEVYGDSKIYLDDDSDGNHVMPTIIIDGGCNPADRVLYHYDSNAANAKIFINGKERRLKLPDIPLELITGTTHTIIELLECFKSRLHIEEDYNITAPVCAFLGNFLAHEPDIIGVVQPSGSIKTELLRTFGDTENQYCYPISSVTEHTFVSGLKDNFDTLPLLQGRAIIIKDLTSLLSRKEDVRAAVFADFRELTDGYIGKEFGNGVKKEYHNIHSSILFGCTPAIER